VLTNLTLAGLMVVVTVMLHFGGLLALLTLLRYQARDIKAHKTLIGQFALVVMVVLFIFIIHAAEIWAYALSFVSVGAILDFHDALYFSTVTFASLGYGDIVLNKDWRLFGAIEAANGLILFGWSTAFLISVTRQLRILEHDWVGRRRIAKTGKK
jgi:Ion channel